MKINYNHEVTIGPVRLLTLAIALAALAFAVAAYLGNPVGEVEDHVGEPVAGVLGFTHDRCPSGWDDVSSNDADEHAKAEVCERGDVLVKLEDGRFNYAVVLGGPFVCDPREVDGWPDEGVTGERIECPF